MKACAIEFSRLQTGGLDARGLVGLNFLKSFQVKIDFKKKILRLISRNVAKSKGPSAKG